MMNVSGCCIVGNAGTRLLKAVWAVVGLIKDVF